MNDGSFSDNSFIRSSESRLASQKSSGMTQAIRLKLNFNDESLWKKFSARRLELIDSMALSEKKASEQDDDITGLADKLRSEYGYHTDTLGDFERLVRAGIQSVRRNRKRVPKSRGFTPSTVISKHKSKSFSAHPSSRPNDEEMDQSPDIHLSSGATSPGDIPVSFTRNDCDKDMSNRTPKHDSEMVDVEPDESHNRGRISISALVSPAAPSNDFAAQESLSPISVHSTTSPELHVPNVYSSSPRKTQEPIPELLTTALDQLVSLVERCEMPHVFPFAQDSAKLDYMGYSVLHTAATLSVQRRRFTSNEDISKFVNSVLLSNVILQSISSVLPASSIFSSDEQHAEHLKLRVAACAMCYGFDSIIRTLSTVFIEIVNSDQLPDGQRFDFQLNSMDTKFNVNHTLYSIHHDTPSMLQMPSPMPSSVASSSCGTSVIGVSVLPSIIPVTLRFFSQKLDFTYAPGSSTPPTIREIMDNGKSAFHILGDNKVLKIRNLNMGGRVIETDNELAEIFETARIDLELYFPVFESSAVSQTTSPKPNSSTKLGLSSLRFQEVL